MMILKRFLVGVVALAVIVCFLFWTNSDVVKADDSAITMTEWSGFTRLSVSGQKASVPSLAIQTNGNLHAAFEQGVPNEDPYYVTSSDGGTTWSTPELISSIGTATIVDKVDLAVANNGNVHAVWIENDTGANTHTLKYASRSSVSWQPAETVEIVSKSPTSILQQPSLVVDGGLAYLVWTRGNDVQFSVRDPRTSPIWSAPQKIGEFALPEIAIDNNGTLHVAFVDDFGKFVVQYTQSTDLGVTWSSAISLSPFSKDVQDLDLIVKDTSVHIAYGAKDSSASSSVPYYTTCSSNCSNDASWKLAEVVTSIEIGTRPADAILLSPSIAITDQNDPLIFFHGVLQENLNFEQVIGSCFDPDGQSGRDFKLPTAFTERMVKPQIVYSDGDMHVVYERIKGQAASTTFQEIHYAKLSVECHVVYLPIIYR